MSKPLVSDEFWELVQPLLPRKEEGPGYLTDRS